MPRAHRITLQIWAVITLVGLTSCSPSEGGLLRPTFGPGTVLAIIVSPTAGSVEVGQTIQMSAKLVDSLGRDVLENVIWVSSNSALASVNDEGLVTGVAAGAATVTATVGVIFRDASVTVVESDPTTQ